MSNCFRINGAIATAVNSVPKSVQSSGAHFLNSATRFCRGEIKSPRLWTNFA